MIIIDKKTNKDCAKCKTFGIYFLLFIRVTFIHGFLQIQYRNHRNVHSNIQKLKKPFHSGKRSSLFSTVSQNLTDISTKNDTTLCYEISRPTKNNAPISIPEFQSEETSIRFHRALLALGSTLSLSYNEATSFLLSQPHLYDTNINNAQLQSPLHTKILYFQSEIGISKTKLKKMILNHPTLIATAINEMDGLKTSIELLQYELNLTGEEVWNLATHSFPQVRTYRRGELRSKLHFYRHSLKFSQEELKLTVLRQPKLLQHSASSLKEAVTSIQSMFPYTSLSKSELKRMIIKFPSFLTYDTHHNLIPTIQYLLESQIGESLGCLVKDGVSTNTAKTSMERSRIIQKRVKQMLLKSPSIVGNSIETNIKPTMQFFLNNETGVGCSMEQLGKILWRIPEMLGFSLHNNLMPKIQYLKDSFLLHDLDRPNDENISQLITRNPNILSYNLSSNLIPKISYFRDELGFTPQELRTYFVTRPQTLSYSLENNIKPKVNYYLSENGGNLTKTELKVFLLDKPGQFTYSLEGRIQVRVQALKDHGIQLRDAPSTIVSRADGSFWRW